MPQVVIDFTPARTAGEWALALRVPAGLGPLDVHKAFILLAQQIAEQKMLDVQRKQQHLEAIREVLAIAGHALPAQEARLITVPPYGTYGGLH